MLLVFRVVFPALVFVNYISHLSPLAQRPDNLTVSVTERFESKKKNPNKQSSVLVPKPLCAAHVPPFLSPLRAFM